MRFIFSTFFLAFALNSNADAVRVDNLIQEQISSGLTRGAAVALIANGNEKKAVYGDATSDQSLFEIGSISKSITGIVAAQLSLEKKLDLHSPISTYVSELKQTFVGSVNVVQLATHLAQLINNMIDANGRFTKEFTEAELISFLKSYNPDLALYPKGKRQYSNLGFATLGLVISRIEKKSFASVAKERVFDVLKMNSTGFISSKSPPSGLLQGYSVALEPLYYESSSDLQLASGGIYSNLADMTIYLRANLFPEFSRLEPAIHLSHQLGLGWDSLPSESITWKNGAMPAGFSSLLMFDRKKKEGVIVMANSLNIAATMHVSDVALDVQPPLYSYVDSIVPAQMMPLFLGSYFSDGGSFEIEVFRISGQYLGLYLKKGFTKDGPEPFYRWRLMQQSTGLFLVNDGVEISDAVLFNWNSAAQKVELIYANFQGFDPGGQPFYEKKIFQK